MSSGPKIKALVLLAGILSGVPAHAVTFDYFSDEPRWEECPGHRWWAPDGKGNIRHIICERVVESDDPERPVGSVRYRWKIP